MSNLSNPNASKTSASISINSDLLREAYRRQIDLSLTLESHLAQLLREGDPADSQQEAREALEEYGRGNETVCLFSGGWRHF